jgi:hypothetical protein
MESSVRDNPVYGNFDGCVRAILVLTGLLGVRCLPGLHTGSGRGYYKKGVGPEYVFMSDPT